VHKRKIDYSGEATSQTGSRLPPPGSSEAIRLGCNCPQAENNFGRGRTKNGVFEPDFVADPSCLVHGFEALFGVPFDSC
jgi:hypothetical protein